MLRNGCAAAQRLCSAAVALPIEGLRAGVTCHRRQTICAPGRDVSARSWPCCAAVAVVVLCVLAGCRVIPQARPIQADIPSARSTARDAHDARDAHATPAHRAVAPARAARGAEYRDHGLRAQQYIFAGFLGLSLLLFVIGGIVKWLVPGNVGLYMAGAGISGAVVAVAFAQHDVLIGWIGLGAICAVLLGVMGYLVMVYRAAFLANLRGIESAKPLLGPSAPEVPFDKWDLLKPCLAAEQHRAGTSDITNGHLEQLGFKETTR
ncbi:MAG TPA: hypothetical protein PKZ08_00565 [Vicinamibacterales bacterium]|nr:hypothetical protein [Vicinamibacterales bacterium]